MQSNLRGKSINPVRHSLGKAVPDRQPCLILPGDKPHMATSTWPGPVTLALTTRLELRLRTRICSLMPPLLNASPGMRTLRGPLRATMTT